MPFFEFLFFKSLYVIAFDPQSGHFLGLPVLVHEFEHLVQKHWYCFSSTITSFVFFILLSFFVVVEFRRNMNDPSILSNLLLRALNRTYVSDVRML